MTVEELVNYCKKEGIPLSTPIVISGKDDHLLVEDNISQTTTPYFGNCDYGDDWLKENAPRDPNGDVDYDNLPNFLSLGTGY